jgi:hypothetical protein
MSKEAWADVVGRNEDDGEERNVVMGDLTKSCWSAVASGVLRLLSVKCLCFDTKCTGGWWNGGLAVVPFQHQHSTHPPWTPGEIYKGVDSRVEKVLATDYPDGCSRECRSSIARSRIGEGTF